MSVIVPPRKFMQISQSTIKILQQSPEHVLSSLPTSFNYWSLHLKLDLKISLTITFWFSRISWTYHVQMNLHSYLDKTILRKLKRSCKFVAEDIVLLLCITWKILWRSPKYQLASFPTLGFEKQQRRYSEIREIYIK